jgi:prepilin-type processing-associated H-X9-DG protein
LLVAENLEWGWQPREPAEVICHNDVAPYNMTFIDGHVAGLFDFDTAAPGPRIWDLAYLAYRLVPFTGDANPANSAEENRLHRLDRLIHAYGEPYSRAAVLQAVAERLDDIARYTDRRASETGRPDFLEHAAMYRRDRERIAGITV